MPPRATISMHSLNENLFPHLTEFCRPQLELCNKCYSTAKFQVILMVFMNRALYHWYQYWNFKCCNLRTYPNIQCFIMSTHNGKTDHFFAILELWQILVFIFPSGNHLLGGLPTQHVQPPIFLWLQSPARCVVASKFPTHPMSTPVCCYTFHQLPHHPLFFPPQEKLYPAVQLNSGQPYRMCGILCDISKYWRAGNGRRGHFAAGAR